MAATTAPDIDPGTTIHVKVVKPVTNAAAAKTVTRLLSKDARAMAENKRHREIRKKAQWKSPRGGRWRVWESRLAKQRPVKAEIGEQGTLTATLDVLRDLPSVQRFVEIKPA